MNESFMNDPKVGINEQLARLKSLIQIEARRKYSDLAESSHEKEINEIETYLIERGVPKDEIQEIIDGIKKDEFGDMDPGRFYDPLDKPAYQRKEN